MIRNRRELEFNFERLEPRLMLSGNVIATIVGGDILIQGDELDNDVSIELVDDDIMLVGDNDTTINGSSNNFLLFQGSQVDGDIKAFLRGGDDSFAIQDGVNIDQSVMIFTGSGNDSIGVGASTCLTRNRDRFGERTGPTRPMHGRYLTKLRRLHRPIAVGAVAFRIDSKFSQVSP